MLRCSDIPAGLWRAVTHPARVFGRADFSPARYPVPVFPAAWVLGSENWYADWYGQWVVAGPPDKVIERAIRDYGYHTVTNALACDKLVSYLDAMGEPDTPHHLEGWNDEALKVAPAPAVVFGSGIVVPATPCVYVVRRHGDGVAWRRLDGAIVARTEDGVPVAVVGCLPPEGLMGDNVGEQAA